MTFNSSNREWLESTTNSGLAEVIRTAMEAGCLRPAHVYDAVDEVLDRLKRNEQLLTRILDYLGVLIKDNLVEDTPHVSDLADDVWDAINIGTFAWKNVKKAKRRSKWR